MYTDFLESVLAEASKIALRMSGGIKSTTKKGDNNQVLTEADLEIGKFIIQKIKSAYPKHNIVDEEAGVIDNKSGFTWVVDPIDGTANFAEELPHYGIMIGLLEGSIPIGGGISLPFFKDTYLAEKGKGSFCNGKRISVTKEINLLKLLVVYQIDGHQENPGLTRDEAGFIPEIVLNIRSLRVSGSAFDYMMVANGKYGAILSKTGKIWDHVAPQIIIEEAGGKYTDFYGRPQDYSNPLNKSKDNFTCLAASPLLHGKLTDIINK